MTREIYTEHRLACIPKRLEVEGRSELSDFPLNVLFACFFSLEGSNFSATALYEPELESFREGVTKKRLFDW